MNLYLSEILEGFEEAYDILKRGHSLFEMGNVPLFPNISSQQKWKFAKGPSFIRLSDGTHVYGFKLLSPESSENEFPLERDGNVNLNDFETGATSKGLAQIHRADPGSIYFTMQEGYKNPTYTFRHTGNSKWKGIPKKKKKKSATPEVVLPNVNPESVKQAFLEAISKEAAIGDSIPSIGNAMIHGFLSPGRDPVKAGLLAAGAGGAYHLLKKKFYNLVEENEEENAKGWIPLLKRTLIPGLGIGLLGALQRGVLHGGDRTGMGPSYYDNVNTGNVAVNNIFR